MALSEEERNIPLPAARVLYKAPEGLLPKYAYACRVLKRVSGYHAAHRAACCIILHYTRTLWILGPGIGAVLVLKIP